MPERIIFPSRGEVALERFDLPDLGPRDVQVRTRFSLMSIGTETIVLHQRYAADTHFARMFAFPQRKTGVQAVGEIEAIGAEVSDFEIGDRVFMRMAHGSHQVLQETNCSPVPEGVDPKSACWCGLAKTAFRAAWAGEFRPDGRVLIIGAGPVGQMVVRWARTEALTAIVVVDPYVGRLKHALNGGATAVFEGGIADFLRDNEWENERPPLVIDTTGNANVFEHTLAAAPEFGRIILIGDTGYPKNQCLTSDFMTKGLTVQAVHDSHDRDGWTQRRIDQKFFYCVQDGRFELDGLITHEFSPRECVQAYALADQQRERVMGIVFDWHET